MGWDGASALSGRSRQLTSLAESAPGLDQYAIRKFAEAFEVRTRDRRPQHSMGLARMLISSILQHTALSEIEHNMHVSPLTASQRTHCGRADDSAHARRERGVQGR